MFILLIDVDDNTRSVVFNDLSLHDKMLNVLMYCIALMILSLVTWTPKTMVQSSNWSIIVNPCQNVLIINL
jgi:hypothetical protein